MSVNVVWANCQNIKANMAWWRRHTHSHLDQMKEPAELLCMYQQKKISNESESKKIGGGIIHIIIIIITITAIV